MEQMVVAVVHFYTDLQLYDCNVSVPVNIYSSVIHRLSVIGAYSGKYVQAECPQVSAICKKKNTVL